MLKIFRRKKRSIKQNLLRPDMYHTAIWAIDFEELSRRGISYLIIDVDSTIADAHSPEMSPGAFKAIKSAMERGFIKNACLVSNVMYGRKKRERVATMARKLGIPYVAASFYNAKPRSSPFVKGLNLLNSRIEDTAVIGDQIFTDILGGNRLGMLTILIQPLGRIHWTTRVSLRRFREGRLLKKMKVCLMEPCPGNNFMGGIHE